MALNETQDGFEEEKGQIVQGSMPNGFSPSDDNNGDDDGISLYAIAAANVMEDIPNLDDQKIKFIEIHSRSTNAGLLYVTDPQGVAGNAAHVKSGREIEPGKSVAYPIRGRSDRGRPRVWSDTIGTKFTVTRGY